MRIHNLFNYLLESTEVNLPATDSSAAKPADDVIQEPKRAAQTLDQMGIVKNGGLANIKAVYNLATPEEKEYWGEWYKHAKANVESLANQLNFPFLNMAAIVAVLSPGTNWAGNISNARQIVEGVKSKKIRSYPQNIEKALSLREMSEEDVHQAVKGPKVIPFFNSLLNPVKTENETMVLDGHGMNIWRGERTALKGIRKPNKDEYTQMHLDYNQAAKDLKITRQALQSVTWYIWKSSISHKKPVIYDLSSFMAANDNALPMMPGQEQTPSDPQKDWKLVHRSQIRKTQAPANEPLQAPANDNYTLREQLLEELDRLEWLLEEQTFLEELDQLEEQVNAMENKERWSTNRLDYQDRKHGARTQGITFYHSSPIRFRHGDILQGGHSGGSGCAHPNVCMTTDPRAHGTISHNIPGWAGANMSGDDDDPRPPVQDRDWYVYEVEPIGKVDYVSVNSEYQAKSAKVVKNLGLAKNFLPREVPSKNDPRQMAREPRVEKDRHEKFVSRQQKRLSKLDKDESDLEEANAMAGGAVAGAMLPLGMDTAPGKSTMWSGDKEESNSISSILRKKK